MNTIDASSVIADPVALRIGDLPLRSRVAQAALSGYSDLPMRRIAREHRAELTMNEVMLDTIVLQGGKNRRVMLSVPDDDHPVVGQLMGAEPESFGLAADLLVEGGYDIIDINFGCPVKKVLGRCRGGYLLSHPPDALDIVQRVLDAVGGRRPVTVKMRRGMDDSAESEAAFWEIFEGAMARGVSGFTVHGRTVRQRYVGPSNWSFLKRVKARASRVPVLGSGDLFNAMAVVKMIEETGVDGVTLARGCIGNPWLFREAEAAIAGRPLPPPPTVPEQGETIRRHFELTCDVYGEERAARVMRKFGIQYSRHHPSAAEVRKAFIAASSSASWIAVLDEWYDGDRDWPSVSRSDTLIDLVAAGSA